MARARKAQSKSKSGRKPARKASAGKRRPAKPIDLYYWPTPNGFKISIMLEECGLPYKLVPVNISKGEQFNPDFLKISPNNRMPAIVDPDGPGGRTISIFESGA
ncbi:MAG TPA: glutathione S-transferase N-terminal domain-containing protein, partial [Pseudolabrys sp.]|nr:glutathione S-transferase N-terminal domain-containing protein [Pseudolabrys sp.]